MDNTKISSDEPKIHRIPPGMTSRGYARYLGRREAIDESVIARANKLLSLITEIAQIMEVKYTRHLFHKLDKTIKAYCKLPNTELTLLNLLDDLEASDKDGRQEILKQLKEYTEKEYEEIKK